MTNRHAAIQVIRKLRRNRFEALLAGGCVRDMLLHRPAKDYDVVTNAHPKDVAKLFRRTIKIGAKFGVVMVLLKATKVEVATFRTETGYVDGRHPAAVEFTGAEEDAGRRDFTINGMFYDPLSKKVIDYVGGRADLRRRLIRTIGTPEQRFGEDFLRMLRAVRFSTQLGFPIEQATKSAIRTNAKNITRISGERIAMELEAILVNPNRYTGGRLLVDCGLAEVIFPDLSREQASFAVNALAKLRKKVDFALALATLFAACPTDSALQNCRILKLSRNQTAQMKFLLTNRDVLLDETMSLGRLRILFAEPYFWDLYDLQKAILKATDDSRAALKPLIKLHRRITALGDIEKKPKPLLNGHDLIRLGVVPGPALGQLTQEMYIAQLEGLFQNRQQAKNWVQKWLEKHKTIED